MENVIATIPHLGQMTVNAIVYKQLPDGTFHPEAIWHDTFSINFVEESVDECVAKLKKIIEEIKNHD